METCHHDDLFLREVTSQRCQRRNCEQALILFDMILQSEIPVIESYFFPENLLKLIS